MGLVFLTAGLRTGVREDGGGHRNRHSGATHAYLFQDVRLVRHPDDCASKRMALCIDILVGCGFLLSLRQSQGELESDMPILYCFPVRSHHHLKICPTLTQFPRHWLFWQDEIGLFNERCVHTIHDGINMDNVVIFNKLLLPSQIGIANRVALAILLAHF